MAHKLGHCGKSRGVEHENQLEIFKKSRMRQSNRSFLISNTPDEEEALEMLKKQ
jgi:hypothetical protein